HRPVARAGAAVTGHHRRDQARAGSQRDRGQRLLPGPDREGAPDAGAAEAAGAVGAAGASRALRVSRVAAVWRSLLLALAIRPGEEEKALLLYSMHFLFYLGLAWGEQASEALFLSAWGANGLPAMFVGTAVLSLAVALVYTVFTDRYSNERVLEWMLGALILWLLSVRVLLGVSSGPGAPVYPYFYLVYGTLRDLSTLQILNYVNDFYDTRAAKRAIPLMLSAGVVASMVAGFSNPLLSRTIGVLNVPLAWIASLGLVLALMSVARARLTPEIAPTRQPRLAARDAETAQGGLEHLRTRYRFVRDSGLLRWLALATFAMVLLMRLLNFEASRVFVAEFHGDSEALFTFYGLFAGA